MISKTTTKTLTNILQQRATDQAHERVFTFLANGETEAITLTYSDLYQATETVAAHLQALPLKEKRALLLYSPGLEFIKAFMGCLRAGVIAIPAYPPRRNRSSPWLDAIVTDAKPDVVLSDTTIHTNFLRRPVPSLNGLHWLTTDQLNPQQNDVSFPSPTPDSLALLQYTSGSTASPKGVMISHSNLLHNLEMIRQRVGLSENSRGVTWLPPYHDMGLINLLGPPYIGMPMTFISPMSFLEKPLRWLQAITREKATISGAPNFAYDLCVDKIPATARDELDLSSWDLAFVGAEPIRAETLERFATTFKAHGFRQESFYPSYGLAEATLVVSCGEKSAAPILHNPSDDESPPNTILVGCGHSWLEQKIVIVDPETQTPQDDEQVGEIWVSGPSIGQGYWHRPQATMETFQAYLTGSGEGPFLRTGDLGFLKAGELFVTGRLKDLIIIRGRNHAPQDIELTAQESHAVLQPNAAAAFSIDVAGEERLVLVIELNREHRRTEVEPVAAAIRANVAKHHDVEVHIVALIRPGHLPKTTSGKVQRGACRTAFLSETLSTIGQSVHEITAKPAPQDYVNGTQPSKQLSISDQQVETEANLRLILAEYLRVPPSEVDLQQPIDHLGLGSLAAIALKTRIEEDYNIELPIEIFFEQLTIQDLIRQYLLEQAPDTDRILSTSSQPEMTKTETQPNTSFTPSTTVALQVIDEQVKFSLLFFSANEAEFTQNKYQLLLEAGKFADEHHFEAIWLPERHFHPFGGLYPDPSLLATALAMTTKNVRLRAGSVVLPLHHPVRVAEAWSVVDNLSNGRVDLAFATGWNPNDFILSPDNFAERVKVTYENIEIIQQLWQGDSVTFPNGEGQPSAIQVHPLPQQSTLKTWLTCTGGEERFFDAGRLGHNVLTALLFQSVNELAEKITVYRQARAEHGYDPNTGKVTLMLHTYIGHDSDTVRETVQEPFMQYLESSADLWQQQAKPLSELSDQDRQDALAYGFTRYYQKNSLMGTPQSCLPLVQQFQAIGVNEIACLIDFGVNFEATLSGLHALADLKGLASE